MITLGIDQYIKLHVSEVCSISFDPPANYHWGTFSHPSARATCGYISITELLQFTIVHSYQVSLGKALFQKVCHPDAIKARKTYSCIGTDKC